MTGSGKTGLSVGLIEEAARGGMPVIVIDPKGDMAQPRAGLRPARARSEFPPWVDTEEAAAKATRPNRLPRHGGDRGRRASPIGASDPARCCGLRPRRAAPIFTPGVHRRHPAQPHRLARRPAWRLRADEEEFRDRDRRRSSPALLGLVGINADPVSSREYILLVHPGRVRPGARPGPRPRGAHRPDRQPAARESRRAAA